MPFQLPQRLYNRLRSMQNLNPARIVVTSFAIVILTGALLLMLPIASRDGQVTPFLTCLFTATSSTCVTGLIMVDTWVHWTLFGQIVIILMIQLGGLGFMTVITLASFALRRRIGLSERLIMVSTLNLNDMDGVVRVVRHALMGTFLFEGVGAILLTFCFIPQYGALGGIWRGLHPAFQWMCTFLFVNVGWVFFRAETIGQGVEFLKRMGNFSNMQLSPGFIESFSMVELPALFTDYRVLLLALALAYAAALCLVMNGKNMDERPFRPSVLSAAGTALLLVWSVLSLSGISTFIYFQF